jgi:hypothetical protein
MSYPEPIQFEDQEHLYKQAKFFYDQYEKAKKEVPEWHDDIESPCSKCVGINYDSDGLSSRTKRCRGCKVARSKFEGRK